MCHAPMRSSFHGGQQGPFTPPLSPLEQKSVSRLGRAIQDAEDEMDAAIRRTNEVHKSQLRQKEAELQELQRLLQVRNRISARERMTALRRGTDCCSECPILFHKGQDYRHRAPALPQAKERSVESLRDTLSTTKRTYESRIAQVESALTVRDAEVRTRL